jgi:hypothetical protein
MLNYLADTCLDRGLLDEAEAAIKQAVELDSDPHFVAANLLILARVKHRQGRLSEFQDAAQEGLSLIRKLFRPDAQYRIGIEAELKGMGLDI